MWNVCWKVIHNIIIPWWRIIEVMSKASAKNKELLNPNEIYKAEMTRMLWTTVLFRVSAYATIATLLISGIITIPLLVFGIYGQIKSMVILRNNNARFTDQQKSLAAGFSFYCLASIVLFGVYLLMMFSGSGCLMNCNDGQRSLMNTLLFVWLFLWYNFDCWGVSSADRALRWQRRGQEFESPTLHHFLLALFISDAELV